MVGGLMSAMGIGAVAMGTGAMGAGATGASGIASNAGSTLLESGYWDNMTSGNLGGAKPMNAGDMGSTGPGSTGTPLQ
jgi:hypothetical protein